MKNSDWVSKVSHHSQLGGVELCTLNNGQKDGVRTAVITNALGLSMQVIIDRAFDIGGCSYKGANLSWISHKGISAPQPFSNKGTDWLKTFGGGFLTTCGLTHVGPPEEGQDHNRGLHGEISNLKGELLQIQQPDLINQDYSIKIVGRVLQSTVFGPHVEMIRTIEGNLFQNDIIITDVITNIGNEDCPHMLLYHMNFGYPLINSNTVLYWNGQVKEGSGKYEKLGKQCVVKCPPPTDDHYGSKEDVLFINPSDIDGISHFGIVNNKLPLSLKVSFSNQDLPWLINWQHWGKNEYVTALEPATNPPIGQNEARKNGELKILAPGNRLTYKLHLEFSERDINHDK